MAIYLRKPTVLTLDIIANTKFDGKPLPTLMQECFNEGWSFEQFCSCLIQFIDEDTAKIIAPLWDAGKPVTRFSDIYTNEELCGFHDKYMSIATSDLVIGTESAEVVTATYSRLIEIMCEHKKSASVQATCTFMLLYKQNVYAIDAANNARNDK